MNKITVIQLLNKIANGEEVPRKLKGNNHTYTLVENHNYEDEDGDILFSDDYFWCNEDFLNKELEIIEEDKEIEEIEIYSDEEDFDEKIHFKNIMRVSKNGEFEVTEEISVIVDKINEIVRKVNELKKGK